MKALFIVLASLLLLCIVQESKAQVVIDTTDQPTWITVAMDSSITWPTFGQCPDDLYAFILSNLDFKTGKKSLRNQKFIPVALKIGKLGTIQRFQIPMLENKENKPFINEVKRLIRQMPRWNAAFNYTDGVRKTFKTTVYLHVYFYKQYYINKLGKT
ncbi:hypothetical protein LX64_04209 [Chitinophaga skermanii]|uniref:TonB-like protein n=1 Tax=Chitinophaga skermanii TaxID=331697 RepID=A0A327QA66_9BACT|nr:hypothetical protein [Chitinophaga skermanii]RAJ00502.1 hypothetical protein LX64_04209 [Chitinophaga skermanii]